MFLVFVLSHSFGVSNKLSDELAPPSPRSNLLTFLSCLYCRHYNLYKIYPRNFFHSPNMPPKSDKSAQAALIRQKSALPSHQSAPPRISSAPTPASLSHTQTRSLACKVNFSWRGYCQEYHANASLSAKTHRSTMHMHTFSGGHAHHTFPLSQGLPPPSHIVSAQVLLLILSSPSKNHVQSFSRVCANPRPIGTALHVPAICAPLTTVPAPGTGL